MLSREALLKFFNSWGINQEELHMLMRCLYLKDYKASNEREKELLDMLLTNPLLKERLIQFSFEVKPQNYRNL
jgi:hypothetical protein